MSPFYHIDFKSLIAKETNGRMRVRLMALSHTKEGANNAQTARTYILVVIMKLSLSN
jgi:hypothetical protein